MDVPFCKEHSKHDMRVKLTTVQACSTMLVLIKLTVVQNIYYHIAETILWIKKGMASSNWKKRFACSDGG